MSYIHGTHEEEQKRLLTLNRLLNERCLEKITLSGTEQVLDIGSGLGVFTRMLAHRLPDGKVIGIEKSTDQLDTAYTLAAQDRESTLVEFRNGSAYKLPLTSSEWQSFDLIFIRFLLEHLSNPLDVLKSARKALKPGGRIILIDDDHANFRITPTTPGFEILWEWYCKVYLRLGNDPFIGRHLVTLLHQAGFHNFKIDFVLFGATHAQPDFQYYAKNLIGILEGARTEILKLAVIDPIVFDQYMEQIELWANMEEATLWYGANWAEARA